MSAFEGFVNWRFTDADCPGARLPTADTVMNGHPPKVLVAFASVTPDVRESKTTWNGPSIELLLTFVIVTVPWKV